MERSNQRWGLTGTVRPVLAPQSLRVLSVGLTVRHTIRLFSAGCIPLEFRVTCIKGLFPCFLKLFGHRIFFRYFTLSHLHAVREACTQVWVQMYIAQGFTPLGEERFCS